MYTHSGTRSEGCSLGSVTEGHSLCCSPTGHPVSLVLLLEPGAGFSCCGLSLLGSLGFLKSRENWLRVG